MTHRKARLRPATAAASLYLLAALCACRSRQPGQSRSNESLAASAGQARTDARPETSGPRVAGTPAPIARQLREMPGTFSAADGGDDYAYSNLPALRALTSDGRQIDALVACIDDVTPSRSTFQGRPVTVGFMCYEGLTQAGYYEPAASNGDIPRTWPGWLTPRSSPAAQRAAQAAWQRVIRDKLFVRP